jgi:hypothetical protein
VRHRSEAPREDDSWFHGGTGLQVNAVQQSTWKNQNNMTISKAAEQKGRTMNPLIQLNKQLQYLFIALLLACFVIPAMGGIQPLTTRSLDLIRRRRMLDGAKSLAPGRA